MVDPASHQPVLAALHADGDPPHLLVAFARAMLHRAPDDLLATLPADVVARRVRGAFDVADDPRSAGGFVVHVRHDVGGTYVEVVSEDRPLMLSTVAEELRAQGHGIRRSFHPILGVVRDERGRPTAIAPARHAAERISVLQLDLTHTPVPDDAVLVTSIERSLDEVWTVTDDHDAMREHVERAAQRLRATAATDDGHPYAPSELAAFLDWLLDDHVVLLAVDERAVTDDGVLADPETSLGLLRDRASSHALGTPELWHPGDHGGDGSAPFSIGRTRRRSPVQRRDRIDVIAITRRDAHGVATVQIRVLGLLTRRGIAAPAATVPVLRRRLGRILDAEDVVEGSYDAIVLTSLFHALPKDELLGAGSVHLHASLLALLRAEGRDETVVRVRTDDTTRTVAVLVSVPGDRWDATLRARLVTAFGDLAGTSDIDVDVSLDAGDHAIARFLLHLSPDGPGVDDIEVRDAVDVSRLDEQVRRLSRSWRDMARDELSGGGHDATAVARLDAEVVSRLPRGYRDRIAPRHAPDDVDLLDGVLRGPQLRVALHPARSSWAAAPVRVVAAKRGDPLELSAFLPILESLGLTVVEEHPHRLDGDGEPVTLHDFGVRADAIDVDADRERVAEAIHAAWRGHLELDTMNRLVLTSGTGWRDVTILRAYGRVRRQLGTAYTPAYVEATMVEHPDVVRSLVDHVHARFDPDRDPDAPDESATRRRVLEALDGLTRLDHDRILRRLLELVDATLRTNAFRPDAVAQDGEPYVSFKLDPSRVSGVPRPVPHREIFVHSPRVEGVHLRAGPVARGGLRWSDRRDDVRTEVLDLLKAQVLKNAVIVPTGAKGGFVLLQEPADPAERRAELRRQYVTFVRGLLDVTDDLDGDRVVPPPGVVRHDGDDPYLVVAADRGTAAFSDTANEIAADYGFWLDDGFASGGSNGYDHKKLGVTARGAWVAVTHHFRELGIDVSSDAFTVAGIGDMSGDVFGNAMVRSRTIRLIAAFDHRHIFLDPDPDPERSFAERERLLALPRSSWADYDRSALGPGGMVVSRSAVRAELSDEVRAALRLDQQTLTPPALIRAVLRAPVDLLFAGGIGTYVKASTERHEDVGDRVNDELRVDATDVRARVVGEGANLAITQRARVELARRGGHLNQDAVDNAAGVATSDIEVNVKILLRSAQDDGALTRDERDRMLTELSDAVVDRALRTVGRQSVAISREVVRSPALVDAYRDMFSRLERDSDLDRDVEVLPNDEELDGRADAGAGLTRPELATVLAWAKRDLKATALASDLPESRLCRAALDRAFPTELAERFPDLLARHRLRRELIATQVANDVVDRMGATFADRLADESSRPAAEVLRAFQAARLVVTADRWWLRLDELEQMQDPARVRELEAPIEELLTALTRALLTDEGASPEERFPTYVSITGELLDGWTTIGNREQRRARQAHARWLVDDLVEPDLARLLACVRDLALVPDVATVLDAIRPERGDRGVTTVADALLRIGADLGVDRLEDGLRRVGSDSPWRRRQRLGLAADLRRIRRTAATTALRTDATDGAEHTVASFLRDRRDRVDRARAVIDDAERVEHHELDALAVAVRTLADAVRAVRR